METCNDQSVAESQAHVLLDEASRSVRLGVTVISHARLVGVEDDTVYLQQTTNCESVVIECTDKAVANLDSTPEPEFEWREAAVAFRSTIVNGTQFGRTRHMTGQSHITNRLPRFDYHVGFVSAPGGFDCSPQEFLRVAPQRTGVIQRVLSIQGYDQTLPIEGRARSFHLVEEAVMALGFSRCQVVGQVGSNWVHCTGTTPDQIEELCDDLGERANLTFLMAGHCIVMALRDMGARKITVSNGYYRPDWAFGINRYLEQAGFDICYRGNLVDQRIYPDIDALQESERATFWDYPVSDATRSLLAAHRAAPAADAIVVTGGGIRTLDCIDAIETMTGKPVVASDVSLYWAMLRALGAKPPGRDFGSLIRSLS